MKQAFVATCPCYAHDAIVFFFHVCAMGTAVSSYARFYFSLFTHLSVCV